MPEITGEEEYVYVGTLGVEGLGDGSDKLVNRRRPPGVTNVWGGSHEGH